LYSLIFLFKPEKRYKKSICVKEHKVRKTLTRYRLSDHSLAIERGGDRRTLPHTL